MYDPARVIALEVLVHLLIYHGIYNILVGNCAFEATDRTGNNYVIHSGLKLLPFPIPVLSSDVTEARLSNELLHSHLAVLWSIIQLSVPEILEYPIYKQRVWLHETGNPVSTGYNQRTTSTTFSLKSVLVY